MPLYLRPEQRRADPAPLHTDDRRAVLAGTAVWAVLLLVSVLMRDDMADVGRGWWPWTALAGTLLGLLGLAYLHHREVNR